MSGDGAAESGEPTQKFELYIKASAIDRETRGSCPICQQFFMMTCLLGEVQDNIDFKVYTVQADCSPKNFLPGWSRKFPVIMVNSGVNKAGQDISGLMYDTFEELETFFESINKECPELKRKNAPNQAAMQVVENIYKHFNHFISGQSTEKGLVSQLKHLNDYLESQETIYLVDNVMSFSDCHLLPRLQHIRVAGKAYRDFDIPKEFTYVWKYLKNSYEQEAFKSTMPSDQDIIFNYEKKAKYSKRGSKSLLEKFTFTLSIPEDYLNGLDANHKEEQEQVAEEEEKEPEPEEATVPATEPVPNEDNGEVEETPQENGTTEEAESTQETTAEETPGE